MNQKQRMFIMRLIKKTRNHAYKMKHLAESAEEKYRKMYLTFFQVSAMDLNDLRVALKRQDDTYIVRAILTPREILQYSKLY
jgi:HPt (histidine-containing phosphotransfer) domain-containing protein